MPKNIYGATKVAAEDLCELVHRDHGLPCVVLRTSRFFPESDDRDNVRAAYDDLNLKVNELLYRRVDLEDVVSAHRLALDRAPEIGFARLIISATTPFAREDLGALRRRRPGRGAAAVPGVRGDLRRPRLADVPDARPRLRQRPGARPARLDAAATTSPPRSSASRRGRTRAAGSRSRSARRATTPSRSGRTRRADGAPGPATRLVAGYTKRTMLAAPAIRQ